MDAKDARILPDMAIKVTFLEDSTANAAVVRSDPPSTPESSTHVIAK